MPAGLNLALPRMRAQPGGGGSAYHPAAEAIFAAFTTPPDTARKGRINDYVLAGIAGGWWAKGDAKYAFMAADAQAACRNWINPGTYDCVAVNSPTFTADVGFTGAATKYLDTGFNPTTAPSPKFTRDTACVAASVMNNVAVAAGMLGNATGSLIVLSPRWSDNNAYNRLNCDSPNNIVAASIDSIGFWSLNRSTSTAEQLYKNAVSQTTTNAIASLAPTNENINILKSWGTSWTGQCGSTFIGSSLNQTEQTTLYQAELAYQAGVATDKIVASFTTPPTAGRKTLIYQYVYAMMDAGAWWDGDADYWFAAADAQASLKNLLQPGTYDAVAVNSPTFTPDQGWTGASTKYLDTGFNPSTAPIPKYTVSNACVSGWSLTNAQKDNALVGCSDTHVGLLPRYTDDKTYSRVNHVQPYDTVTTLDGTGLFSTTRPTALATETFKNGSSIVVGAVTATVLPVGNIWFLRTSGFYWTGQIASGSIGAHRDATKQLAVYNAKLAYKVGLLGLTYTNPETGRIVDAFTTPPTQARVNLLDAYVTAMKAAGAWGDNDADYWFAAADAQASLINLVNPGTYNAVAVNSPTFTADRGFTGNGTTSYIDANFNPNTAPLPKYTLNDANVSVWPLNNIQDSGQLFGVTNPHSMINPRYINDTFFMRLNNNTTNTGGASLDCRGLWAISRTGASASEGFKNGVSVGTNAGGATQVPSACWFLRGETYYSTNQVASGSLGASRNATKQLAVYNAKRAYATGVGIP